MTVSVYSLLILVGASSNIIKLGITCMVFLSLKTMKTSTELISYLQGI